MGLELVSGGSLPDLHGRASWTCHRAGHQHAPDIKHIVVTLVPWRPLSPREYSVGGTDEIPTPPWHPCTPRALSLLTPVLQVNSFYFAWKSLELGWTFRGHPCPPSSFRKARSFPCFGLSWAFKISGGEAAPPFFFPPTPTPGLPFLKSRNSYLGLFLPVTFVESCCSPSLRTRMALEHAVQFFKCLSNSPWLYPFVFLCVFMLFTN
jgi:hypothetical protein